MDAPASNDIAPARVRRAGSKQDFDAAGDLLDRFNREYDEPTPGAEFLGGRLAELDGTDCATLLAVDDDGEPAGVGVVRFRASLWSRAAEAYIAELYVVPGQRRQGLGSKLMETILDLATERGCEWIELGTDEGDHDAHRLYRRFGFSNFVDPQAAEGERERMFVYERHLH